MAEAFDVAVAPHCPLGPVALASCVQLDFCTPNVFIQEQSLGIHYNQGGDLMDYLKDASLFSYKNGFIGIPQAPGLGVEVDEDKIRAAAKAGHNWKKPRLRNFRRYGGGVVKDFCKRKGRTLLGAGLYFALWLILVGFSPYCSPAMAIFLGSALGSGWILAGSPGARRFYSRRAMASALMPSRLKERSTCRERRSE